MGEHASAMAPTVEFIVPVSAPLSPTLAPLDLLAVAAERSAPPRERSRAWLYAKQLVLTSAPLAVADVCGLLIGTALALAVTWLLGMPMPLPLLPAFAGACGLLCFAFLWAGLYPGVGLGPIVELRQTVLGSLAAAGLMVTAEAIFGLASPALSLLSVVTCLVSSAFSYAARTLARRLVSRFVWWGHPAIIFGGGAEAIAVYRDLRARPWLGLRPVGIADEYPSLDLASEADFYLGSPEVAQDAVQERAITWAIVAMPGRRADEVQEIVERYAAGIPHRLVLIGEPQASCLCAGDLRCGGLPALAIREPFELSLAYLAKRIFDVAVVLAAAPFALLLLPLALFLKMVSPGPLFYRQARIGRGGRRFCMWKLRTMVIDAEERLEEYLQAHPDERAEWLRSYKLKHDPRITPAGKWLRQTSLDELPQLWNVLCGDMSLVGPRPIPLYEEESYGTGLLTYQRVAPGLTGLWQVSGRANKCQKARADLDCQYVRNWSPWLDIYILAKTPVAVLRKEGAR